MEDCKFCKIVQGLVKEEIIYEDDLVLAFPDKHPVCSGHTLIIPKQHFENIFELPDDVLQKIIIQSKILAGQLKEQFKADGLNLMQANGLAAQQSIFHFHFHLVPRHLNDDLDLWFHSRDRN